MRVIRRAVPTLILAVTLLTTGIAGLHGAGVAPRMEPISVAAPAAVGDPSPAHESQFVARINSYRQNRGLNALSVHAELVSVARNWTEKMARDGRISHNPNLANEVDANWSKLGENVGVGYDVDGLWRAFLNSPAHHSNVVDPDWTHVGVGVVIHPDGRMFTTHNFMRLEGGGSPPPPPPTTAPPATSVPPTFDATPTTTGATTSTTAAPVEEFALSADPDRVAVVLFALRPLVG